MKVRADIAALIREGHTNTSIAHRLNCDPSTVARAREALHLPPADKLGRLYAEALPTGRVKDYRPDAGLMPLSPARQAANRAALLAALKSAAQAPVVVRPRGTGGVVYRPPAPCACRSRHLAA
jgi:hypothetical protein